MKLSKWAKSQGISYNTAWRWCKTGKMPCQWEKTPTGTIIIHVESKYLNSFETIIYSRVSSSTKKEDLNRQEERCVAFCEARGYTVNKSFKEIASGMNDNRKKLNQILELPPCRLVVENKDRLTRFGFAYLEKLLTKAGWEVIIINEIESDEQDLMTDLISIITSFCCRFYGLRRGHKKAALIKENLKDDND
jgi:predicted site-specific integrase-resolvase